MTISEYLTQGGSFLAGLQLLRAAGDHRTADRLQLHAQRPFVPPSARAELQEALRYLEGRPLPEVTAAPPPPAKRPEEPPEIDRLRQQGRLLKKREARLHAELCLVAQQEENEERAGRLHSIAREIMEDIEPQLDDIYGQLRAWDQEGVPPVSDRRRIMEETVAKMNRRETLRSRIYRLRKWLDGGKNLSEEKRRAYQVELNEKELELREIEESLGLG